MADPLIGYHGTSFPSLELGDLDPRKAIETKGTTFFTSNEDMAYGFTQPREYGEIVTEYPTGETDEFGVDIWEEIEPGPVLGASLDIKNPFTVRGEDAQRAIDDTRYQGQLIEKAKSAGHDGVIFKNVSEFFDPSIKGDVYGVFDKSQIRDLSAPSTTGKELVPFEEPTPPVSQREPEKSASPKVPSWVRTAAAIVRKGLPYAQLVDMYLQWAGQMPRETPAASGSQLPENVAKGIAAFKERMSLPGGGVTGTNLVPYEEPAVSEKGAGSEDLYHVTFTKNIPEIQKRGINPLSPSLWRMAATGERYQKEPAVFAFTNAEDALHWAQTMEWEFRDKASDGVLGTETPEDMEKRLSKISIIKVGGGGLDWAADPTEDYRVGKSSRHAKSFVRPENIIDIMSLPKGAGIDEEFKKSYPEGGYDEWKQYYGDKLRALRRSDKKFARGGFVDKPLYEDRRML